MSMKSNSLVLYKNNPAIIKNISDKIEIELPNKNKKRVRSKDLLLIHSGPIENLDNLDKLSASKDNIEDAWELLLESSVDLSELADLIFDKNTPYSAWSAWKLLSDGLYFKGDINNIEARSKKEIQESLSKKESKANAELDKKELLERIKNGEILPEDSKYMREIEQVALGKTSTSRLMQELNQEQIPEKAHFLLLNTKFWNNYINPYPQRFNILETSKTIPEIPELPTEERCDLTYLSTY
ncbi:MAG TPA: hypothetical protein QF753_18085, partial [Victivallales bacterium]|nr:hypothetical protein [Victivallales bacterium]